jgi:hypothetical protein
MSIVREYYDASRGLDARIGELTWFARYPASRARISRTEEEAYG